MKKKNYLKRILAAVLAFVMVASGLPDMGHSVSAAESSTGNVSGVISTTDDPQTLTRPLDTYGNSTLNAGKILVGKSVTDGINDSTGEKEVLELTDEIFHMKNADGSQMELKWEPDTNNFLVTVSQSAQMYGVSSEIPIPLDVVFVLDTSGSMDQPYKVDGVRPGGATTNRAQDAVAAINETIATLMALNEYNRVSVVTFSAHNSDWDNDGMTTAGNEASSVLSPLAHYSGEAATSHLTWRGTTGNMRYLWGRNANGNVANSRNGYSGGTNIQSGMYLGAQQLLNVTDTTVVIEGKEITRMPFIIFVSDGAPVASSATNEWWQPSMTAYQGDLGNPYAGNAFLPILVASYYKQQITEKYYPDGDGAAMFYTIGVGLNSENRDETEAMSDLARMVLNPSEEFISSSGNQYYNEIERCWNSYLSGIDFEVQVDQKRTVVERDNWGRETTYTHNGYFYFHKNEMDYPNDFYMDFTENANGAGDADTPVIVSGGTKIAGNMITWNNMSLHYNDEYYDVEDSTTLAETFRQLIIEIQKRAITDPTKVNTTWGEGFSGYVTFTDIIGEYMEVKGIKGVTTGGYLYQGKTFAKLAENYTLLIRLQPRLL
ncbi:MAG: VWA domain-containing protein, partial [Lachnospiraceae bacterium]|nr:VWA domain-containing protein [Lachnospiraceae bacterium]